MLNSISKSFLLVVLASIAAFARAEDTFDRALFGDAETFEIVMNPDRVTVCLLDYQGERTSMSAERADDPKSYKESGITRLGGKRIREIQTLLNDPLMPLHESRKACIPVWGARYRFSTGEKSVDLELCFECMVLRFVRDRKAVGWTSFDHFQDRFLNEVIAIFPKKREFRFLLTLFEKNVANYREAHASQPEAIKIWLSRAPGNVSNAMIATIRKELIAEIPNGKKRALAVLEAFGYTMDDWPSIAVGDPLPLDWLLLLDVGSEDLIAALLSSNLTSRQFESVAWFVASGAFARERPEDAARIPEMLKRRIIEHADKSGSASKQIRARRQFGIEFDSEEDRALERERALRAPDQ